jgi:hypothetical protein
MRPVQFERGLHPEPEAPRHLPQDEPWRAVRGDDEPGQTPAKQRHRDEMRETKR